MTSFGCWKRLVPLGLLAAFSLSLLAQGNAVLSIAPMERLSVKRGAAAEVRLKAELRPGYHVNSDKPADEFLIPLKLTWAKEPFQTGQIIYPKPQLEKSDFSPAPLSVFSGNFEIVTRFRVPANASNGPAILTGKLRYQACNNKECLPPRTIDVSVTVDIQ